jgi:hypothetical protein
MHQYLLEVQPPHVVTDQMPLQELPRRRWHADMPVEEPAKWPCPLNMYGRLSERL